MDRLALGLAAAFLLFALAGPAAAQPPIETAPHTPSGEQPDAWIGYATVADALADLLNKPGVKASLQEGWTQFEDPATLTLWSFAPESNPSYPSAVRRKIVKENGAVHLQMTIKCEAAKVACDDLALRFEKLNEQLIDSLNDPAH